MELINENINYEALEQQVKQTEQDYIKLCVEYKTHFNSYTQLLERGQNNEYYKRRANVQFSKANRAAKNVDSAWNQFLKEIDNLISALNARLNYLNANIIKDENINNAQLIAEIDTIKAKIESYKVLSAGYKTTTKNLLDNSDNKSIQDEPGLN